MTSTTVIPTAKYLVNARFEVNGVVEKPDVIGAIFGQTEGLFGPELDLRELQKGGRIGRIEVEMKVDRNRTVGTIILSSSLDKASTSILAAAVESVDRVGPYESKVTIEKIEDVRDTKRRQIIKRAKEILKRWSVETTPETEDLLREVMEVLKPIEVSTYGPEQLPAGPDVSLSPTIIVVEGRADVINLLRCGIRNVIAINGAKVPETIIKLSKEKEVTVFLDGDRAGDLILKDLAQVVDVKYVARAPPGKEVEELSAREVAQALKDKTPLSALRGRPARVTVPHQMLEAVNQLRGTFEAVLLNDRLEPIGRLPVSELAEKLPSFDNISAAIFDGVITQRLVELAAEKGVKYLIGGRVSDVVRRPPNLRILTFDEVAPTS
ncbi:MAG: DNA primase DnaG [Candidatus Bathyarchaeia archaeon]